MKNINIEVLKRYREIALGLVRQNPSGKLPYVTWLRKNGYVNLDQYMHNHPTEFQDIEQEVKVKTYSDKIRKKYVNLAETLAKESGGQLPYSAWLAYQGHKNLVSYMAAHSEFFEHIDQEIVITSSEEHVKNAETIAQRHGGNLPRGLGEYGWALYKYMRRHPELFAHIRKKETEVVTYETPNKMLRKKQKIG